MNKNKLKNILILENWAVIYLEIYIKAIIHDIIHFRPFFFSIFSIFCDIVILYGGYLVLKERFLAYKNDKESKWKLSVLIIISCLVNWYAIDEIIKLFLK